MGEIEPNLEVGQRVGYSENPEEKTAGHNSNSIAKMAILLEYCSPFFSLNSYNLTSS